jgi:hypothetical protein
MKEQRIRGRRRRVRGATPKHLAEMGVEINAGRAEILVGVCCTCGQWFPVDDVGEACPADATEDRVHAVNYYVLVGVRR